LISTLLAGACARSAIDTEELEEDSSPSSVEDAGAGPQEDAAPAGGEDAGTQPELDAAPPPDASMAPDAAQPPDAGDASAMDAAQPEAGPPDGGGASDAALDAARDAAPDAARDAAPVDAAPPRDTAPPPPPCTAGDYRGAFNGTVDVVIFEIPLFNVELTGTISLTAVAEPGTESFAVTNGRVTGQDTQGNAITGTVTGSLNCTTGKVEDGKLVGTYAGGLFQPVEFTGNVVGTYTNTPPSANGTWATETASTPLLRGGSGTWNIALVQ
jgi:hypothetical protein